MIFSSPVGVPIYASESGTRMYRSQPFGCTGYPAEQQLGGCAHFHRAVDIAPSDGRSGVNLLAAAAGKVFASGTLNDGAKVVGIYHGAGWATGYAHNAANLVSVGQQVARGEHIAEMGQSGNATGNHVHWIVKADFIPSGDPFTDLNDLILDDPKYGYSGIEPKAAHGSGKGTWADGWARLDQNVRVKPKASDGIHIRVGSSTADAVYAVTTADGRIKRSSDGADLGSAGAWRFWGGTFTGGTYPALGTESNRWEKISIDGRWLYIASLLAVRSAS